MHARALARDLLPPLLLRGLRALRGTATPGIAAARPLCRGAADWDAALRASIGYDATEILRRVEAATQQVVAGHAAFERDAVTFAEIEHPFPVLAGLLRAAVEADGPLTVLDFGGSLGSSYRQCRAFLSVLPHVRWMVVEQGHVAAAGRARYATDELSFHAGIDDAVAAHRPHVVLASSSLQYLRAPHAVLARLAATGASTLLIDRTPLVDAPADRVIVQEVPPSIYPASYPCWILGRARLLAAAGPGWELLSDYPCADAPLRTDAGDVPVRGCILRRGS